MERQQKELTLEIADSRVLRSTSGAAKDDAFISRPFLGVSSLFKHFPELLIIILIILK